MSNIYWMGVRESDLLAVKHLYCGSITFFGSNETETAVCFTKEPHGKIITKTTRCLKASTRSKCS